MQSNKSYQYFLIPMYWIGQFKIVFFGIFFGRGKNPPISSDIIPPLERSAYIRLIDAIHFCCKKHFHYFQKMCSLVRSQNTTYVLVFGSNVIFPLRTAELSKFPQQMTAMIILFDLLQLHCPSKCFVLFGLYSVKWPKQKQVCHSHDDALPLSFQLQVNEAFF